MLTPDEAAAYLKESIGQVGIPGNTHSIHFGTDNMSIGPKTIPAIRALLAGYEQKPKRGEWTAKKFPDEESGERFEMEFFVCSTCGNKVLWRFMRTPFCSQCGADMRGPCDENRRKEK